MQKKFKTYLYRNNRDVSSSAFSALTIMGKNSKIKIKMLVLIQQELVYQLLKKVNANIKFFNLKKKNNELRADILLKVQS